MKIETLEDLLQTSHKKAIVGDKKLAGLVDEAVELLCKKAFDTQNQYGKPRTRDVITALVNYAKYRGLKEGRNG